MIRILSQALAIVCALLLLIAEVQRNDDAQLAQNEVQVAEGARPVEYDDLEQVAQAWP